MCAVADVQVELLFLARYHNFGFWQGTTTLVSGKAPQLLFQARHHNTRQLTSDRVEGNFALRVETSTKLQLMFFTVQHSVSHGIGQTRLTWNQPKHFATRVKTSTPSDSNKITLRSARSEQRRHQSVHQKKILCLIRRHLSDTDSPADDTIIARF